VRPVTAVFESRTRSPTVSEQTFTDKVKRGHHRMLRCLRLSSAATRDNGEEQIWRKWNASQADRRPSRCSSAPSKGALLVETTEAAADFPQGDIRPAARFKRKI